MAGKDNQKQITDHDGTMTAMAMKPRIMKHWSLGFLDRWPWWPGDATLLLETWSCFCCNRGFFDARWSRTWTWVGCSCLYLWRNLQAWLHGPSTSAAANKTANLNRSSEQILWIFDRLSCDAISERACETLSAVSCCLWSNFRHGDLRALEISYEWIRRCRSHLLLRPFSVDPSA